MILNEITERVLLQDGSNALIRGVVHMAKKLSGSFISLGKHDSSNPSLGSLPSLDRVDSTGKRMDTTKIIYEDEENTRKLSVDGLQEGFGSTPLSDARLSKDDIVEALRIAHVKCSDKLKTKKHINASLSGSTAISVLLRDNTMYVSNVGDSRALLVSQLPDGKYKVQALGQDQTPHRKGERESEEHRARVMSMDQMDGLAR